MVSVLRQQLLLAMNLTRLIFEMANGRHSTKQICANGSTHHFPPQCPVTCTWF